MIRPDGPSIMLGSGTYFDFDDPAATPVAIEDIAYGLASASRFAGQCVSQHTGKRVRYTVAEHCVRMSLAIEYDLKAILPGDSMDALMHEVGEAVCGDMVSPLKLALPSFKAIEKRVERVILDQFGVPMRNPALIKHHDRRMLATEKRDLSPHKGRLDSDTNGIEPYDWFHIGEPWRFEEAAERFLARYHQLRA